MNRRFHPSARGMALVGFLVLTVLISLLGTTFLYMAYTRQQAATQYAANLEAFYLSEAAAQHGLWRILHADTPPSEDTYYMHDLGGGRYGYRIIEPTEETFAGIATVGVQDDTVARGGYVLYFPPLWFGNKEIGPNIINKKNVQFATQVELDDPADITAILLYMRLPPPKKYRFAIYADEAGEPGALLYETSVGNWGPNQPDWCSIALPENDRPGLSPGTYWLACAFAHSNSSLYVSDPGEGQMREKNHDAVKKGFTDPWGTSDESNTRRMSIYATYVLP